MARKWSRSEMGKFLPSLSVNFIIYLQNVWSAMSLSLLVPEEKKLPISAINFQKSVFPLYVNTTLYRNSRISRLYCGKTIKDRGFLFGMVPTHILKAKTAKFQVLTPFGSLFFRYPIFKVYTIVYNSAGRFSTPLNIENVFLASRFSTFHRTGGFAPCSMESGGFTPLLPGVSFSPVALASAVILILIGVHNRVLRDADDIAILYSP